MVGEKPRSFAGLDHVLKFIFIYYDFSIVFMVGEKPRSLAGLDHVFKFKFYLL